MKNSLPLALVDTPIVHRAAPALAQLGFTMLLASTSMAPLQAQGVSGDIVVVPCPSSVVPGDTEGDIVLAFSEQDGVLLTSDVIVDYLDPGTYVGVNEDGPLILPAGIRVRSYFLHLDPPGFNSREAVGEIVFDRPVLALITASALLDASDTAFGCPMTLYPSTGSVPLRGYEDPPIFHPDTVILDADRRTVRLDTIAAATATDQMRILLLDEVGTRYCQAGINSTGTTASIFATGSAEVSNNALTLWAEGLPAGEAGLFFFGNQQTQFPFGDGYRCVGGSIARLHPVLTTDSSGVASRSVDLTSPPALGRAVPNVTLNFQLWFRDPGAMGSGFNLSDGTAVAFR